MDFTSTGLHMIRECSKSGVTGKFLKTNIPHSRQSLFLAIVSLKLPITLTIYFTGPLLVSAQELMTNSIEKVQAIFKELLERKGICSKTMQKPIAHQTKKIFLK